MYGPEALLVHLKERGLPMPPAIERAFLSVDIAAMLPQPLSPLAYANAPIPYSVRFRGTILPSPPILAALLQLLEPAPGLDIGVVGAMAGYPAALAAHVMKRGSVVIVEPDEELREQASRNIEEARLADRISAVSAFKDHKFDRILLLDSTRKPTEFMKFLGDPGFVVSRGLAAEGMAFRKRIRSGSAELELDVADMPVGPRGGSEAHAMTWARLLARDELVERAWEARVLGPQDTHFADAIEETFRGGPLDSKREALDVRAIAARRSFHVAYIVQHLGELRDAADLYERSLALFPTAEGHTFLGWAHSFMGDADRAIAECKRAIEVDPTFGNPYNDIGAYLIELGRHDEAIEWLKKALVSERYCCYFFAHTNLGRAYMMKGLQQLARKHFEEALKVNPGYEPAQEMLRRLGHGIDYVA